MRRNNDRMLLESLVRKYGKNGVKNAIRRINENANSDFEIKNGVLVKYRGKGGKVIIPDSVTKIGWGAFAGCESLTSVTIPDSVTEIGRGAFDGCSRLASITIPDSVTKIVGATFRGCSSLKSVTIPDSVTLIGDYAFYGCKSLQSIIIPDSVTTIAGGAFEGCSSLVNIKIPNGVKIGKNAFKDTKNNIVKSINEMEEQLEPITIYIDYMVDDSMQLRKDIMCFRKNGIKAECEIEEQFDNMELTAISEKSKCALTDWLLNYHLDDVDLIEEYWPELLPYVDDCVGIFVNYNNCF